jgi:hypothetical protein
VGVELDYEALRCHATHSFTNNNFAFPIEADNGMAQTS